MPKITKVCLVELMQRKLWPFFPDTVYYVEYSQTDEMHHASLYVTGLIAPNAK